MGSFCHYKQGRRRQDNINTSRRNLDMPMSPATSQAFLRLNKCTQFVYFSRKKIFPLAHELVPYFASGSSSGLATIDGGLSFACSILCHHLVLAAVAGFRISNLQTKAYELSAPLGLSTISYLAPGESRLVPWYHDMVGRGSARSLQSKIILLKSSDCRMTGFCVNVGRIPFPALDSSSGGFHQRRK